MRSINQYSLAPGVSDDARQLMQTVSNRAAEVLAAHHQESGDIHVSGLEAGYHADMAYDPTVAHPVYTLGMLSRMFGGAVIAHSAPQGFLPSSLKLVCWNEERYSVSQRDTQDGPVYDVSRRFWGRVEQTEYNPRTHMCTQPDITHHQIEF